MLSSKVANIFNNKTTSDEGEIRTRIRVANSDPTFIFLKSYDWIYQHSLFFGHSRFRSARVFNSMCKQYKKKRFRYRRISAGIVILSNSKFPYREANPSLLGESQVS